jgi:hypothetical protein
MIRRRIGLEMGIRSLAIIVGLWEAIGAQAQEQGTAQGFLPLRDQKIILKGDSIAKGYGFGNYNDPSPLRTVYGIGAILLRENIKEPPAFGDVSYIWEGLNPDGTPKTVDTLADELNTNIKKGEIKTGDWLIFEDAGQYDMNVHPAPFPWEKYHYLRYRQYLRDMVHAVEDVIDRTHIVFMTMFDYNPVCPTCAWDKPLDIAGRTANDAIRDEGAELGIRVIDMNRIMDAAHEYLTQKGWGRTVGPDGIHPNVYGNYVMALAILGTLGGDLAPWKLDPLYRHFAHSASGGDVTTVWGFKKDPSDAERIEILEDLRAIVVRELAKSPPAPTPPDPSLYPRVVRHGRFLSVASKQPENTTHPAVYELGKLYQLDRDHAMLVASIREQGGHDFEIGNNAFIFKELKDIDERQAIPINRLDANYRLKTNGALAIQARYPVSGAFVPLGAKLPDGTSHPGAGTGFLFSGTLTFLPDRSDGHPDAGREDRTIEFMQIRWDGKDLKVTQREFLTQAAGVDVGRIAITNSLPDGAGFLCPFESHDGGYVVVVRYEYDGQNWKPVRAGKPFHEAEIPKDQKNLPVEHWFETEASIVRDGTRYLLYTRGHDFRGRVYSSTDGLNYTFLFDHYNYQAPQTLNQGLDGSIYLITNRGPGLLRNPLLAFPLRDKTFPEPFVIHDERRVHLYFPKEVPETPFIDHALGTSLLLGGRWRHFVAYRVIGVHETDGKGAPPGPHSGVYIDELIYDRVTHPPYRF